MGIAYGALKLLFDQGKQERWQGKLLTLGRQDIAFTFDRLNKAAREHGYALAPCGPPVPSRKPEEAAKGNLGDDWFFRALGFSGLHAMDMSGYENADIIHDLNADAPPGRCVNAYDAVLDGGTLEHVFHLPNALSSVCRMVKIGGRILHINPMSNCADHGFYSFSPTLLVDFYSANRFKIEKIAYIRFDRDPCADEWTYTDYKAGAVDYLGPGIYYLVACVRRVPGSTWNRIPQQGYYVSNAWRASGGV